MLNETLKELFDAYKHLPVGVILFRDGRLFFVNDHLHALLLLDNLSSDDIVEVIGGMVGIETPTHAALHRFLLENPHFIYKNRIIQIDRTNSAPLDIFVLVRIADPSIALIDRTRTVRELNDASKTITPTFSGEPGGVARILGPWEAHQSFVSLVLYKGIPIKGSCDIESLHEGQLKLHVDRKQLVAAKAGVQWLIGSHGDTMISGRVVRYDLDTQSVWLDRIEECSVGFHRRSVIRYALEEGTMTLSVEGKRRLLPLRDLSEKGVSVIVEDHWCLAAVSAEKTFSATLTLSEVQIKVRVHWVYTAILEEGSQMKAAFTMSYDPRNGALLREWLNQQQLNRIKEVRRFVQMAPSRS